MNELDEVLSSYVTRGYDSTVRGITFSKFFCKGLIYMFIVGIDIAKFTHVASIMDKSGNLIGKTFKFSNSSDGFNKLLENLNNCSTSPADFEIGMESTGHYWLSLYTHLFELGYNVHVINPVQSDALRGLFIRQSKNDFKDSFIIAEVIRIGRYSESVLADNDLFALRDLTRQRFFLVDMISDLKRKVISLLDRVFPEYSSLFTDTFGATSLKLLETYTTPEEILSVPTEDLFNFLSTASKGRFKFDKAEQIQALAKNTFGTLLGVDSCAFMLKQFVEQIQFLENQMKDLEVEISKRLASFNSPIQTITGIGEILGAVIISEIGNINRFDSPDKLAAFAGIDPTVKQSGEFEGSKNKMSKRGSPYLRRAIWLASSVAIIYDPAIKAFYDKKRSQGKHHYTALGAVCKKMCNIIFAVLKSNKPYVPTIS